LFQSITFRIFREPPACRSNRCPWFR